MPDIPGLDADVYFGSVDAELPEWNGTDEPMADENEEDHPLSEEQRDALIGVLGFDPAELDDDASPEKE